MPTPCFLLEPTGVQRVQLRRFVFGVSEGQAPDQEHRPCREGRPWPNGYREGCNATSPVLYEVPAVFREDGILEPVEKVSRDDPRWPAVCERCGVPFDPEDPWQTNGHPVYRVAARVDGAALELDALTTLREAPGGAMWWAEWARAWAQGFDGRALIVKLPNGIDWQVDSEASNCTRKGDRTHRCWLRHGEPPLVSVDKDGRETGQETCSAGAGSILSGDYHGFLRDGILT